jgi:molecular chaperone GrpE
MHEEETELTVMEPGDTAAASAGEEPADESSLPVVETVIPEETVSRAAYDQLKTERDQLSRERDQLLERIARLQAEFDNARKRAEREKIEFRDYATGNVVEQFLPVVDNFELALKSTGTAEQMRHGVELIVKQMEEILARLQVTAIPTVGEAFDPRLHEALGSVERDDIPDQHVAEEIRRGYKIRERMLRPAMVRVAHNAKQVTE